jgi:hypothetical protein
MSEGVVPDYVSTLGNFGGDVGPLMDVAANQEERSLNVMPRQNVKQIASVRIVGPVVEGQCDLLRSSVTTTERASKPLPGWSERLVSSSSRSNSSRSNYRRSEHAAILNA